MNRLNCSIGFYLLPSFLIAVCNANLVNVDLVINPYIEHRYSSYENDALNTVQDWMRISIPVVSLHAGDILQVAIAFSDNQGVQFCANERYPYLEFVTTLVAGDPYEYGVINGFNNNSTAEIDITKQEGFVITNQSVMIWGGQNEYGYLFEGGFDFNIGEDIVDGAILKSFTITFNLPTELDSLLFSSDTYSGTICIQAGNYIPYDTHFLTIVPEPSSILLLGIGLIMMYRCSDNQG